MCKVLASGNTVGDNEYVVNYINITETENWNVLWLALKIRIASFLSLSLSLLRTFSVDILMYSTRNILFHFYLRLLKSAS